MKLALLGGSQLIYQLASYFNKSKLIDQLNILISPRLSLEASSSGKTLNDQIIELIESNPKIKINYSVIDSLDDQLYEEYVKDIEFALSISASWIYKQRHIDLTPNLLQLHSTSLPQWRGGAPWSWKILSGINYSSINIFRVDKGVDSGAIVYSEKFFIPPSLTTPLEWMKFIQKKSFESLVCFCEKTLNGKKIPLGDCQQEQFSSYFPRLDSSIHACIDWSWNATNITRFISAFDDPYPGSFTNLNGYDSRIHLKGVRVIEGECNYHPFQAGIIFRKDNLGIYICCDGGAIHVSKVFDENGINLIPKIRLGDRFYTKSGDLDLAREIRAKYSNRGKI